MTAATAVLTGTSVEPLLAESDSSTASACHSPEDNAATCLPWSGHPRAADKNALLNFAREHPEGVPVVYAARTVLDPDADAGGADHRLALRFYREHSDLFRTARLDGLVWIEPRTAAFHLTTSKQEAKYVDGSEVAKSNARRMLGRRSMVKCNGVRAGLLGSLGAKREATEDRFVAFEDQKNPGMYRLVPYVTRFNSVRRAREARERFDRTWEIAGDRFVCGVILTLTTDPSRFDSLADATDTLLQDVNRLKSWVANRFSDGTRPKSIVVPEFTDSGLPHVHIVFFGLRFIPQPVLSHYWNARRDRADIVWCDPILNRGDQWRWHGRPDRANGRGPREYLGKTLGDLATLAAADPTEVHNAAARLRADEANPDDVARDWWKLALYWATETRLFTASPSIRPDEDDSNKGESEPARWRFVGVARYGEFPAHVTANATVIPRSGSCLRSRLPPNPPPTGVTRG